MRALKTGVGAIFDPDEIDLMVVEMPEEPVPPMKKKTVNLFNQPLDGWLAEAGDGYSNSQYAKKGTQGI